MAGQQSIYMQDRTLSAIELRSTNKSEIVNRDLERLYTLYERALKEVDLEINEALLICDVLNGTLMDANTARLLWAEVEDGIKLNGLDEKWEVDGAQLVQKLRGFTQLQCLALVDAAERFWASTSAGEPEDGAELVRKAFLLKGARS